MRSLPYSKISTEKYYHNDYLTIIMISLWCSCVVSVVVFVFLPSAVLLVFFSLIFRSLTVQFVNLHILQKILWVPFCKEIFLSSFWVIHFFFFLIILRYSFLLLLLLLSLSSSLTKHSLCCFVYLKNQHTTTQHIIIVIQSAISWYWYAYMMYISVCSQSGKCVCHTRKTHTERCVCA